MKTIYASFKTEKGEEICKWDFDLNSFFMATQNEREQIWRALREQFDAYIKQEVSL